MSGQQWYYTDTPVYPLGGLLLFVVFIVVVIVWVSWFVPYNPWDTYNHFYPSNRGTPFRRPDDPLGNMLAENPKPVPFSAATKPLGGSYNPSWARGSTVGDGDMHQMLMSRITIDGFFKKT